MRMYDIITDKKQGRELSKEQIEVRGYHEILDAIESLPAGAVLLDPEHSYHC